MISILLHVLWHFLGRLYCKDLVYKMIVLWIQSKLLIVPFFIYIFAINHPFIPFLYNFFFSLMNTPDSIEDVSESLQLNQLIAPLLYILKRLQMYA